VASTQAQPSRATTPPGAAGTYALTAPPLIALTQDPRFFATLKKVTDPVHAVRVAGSEIDLAAVLMSQHAAVAVLDSAALATPIEKLTARLHAQFPDLVLIVAGTADEQGLLAAQITDGSVHRFLHKPLSEQRVRLFVEAAWRRYEEGGRRAAPAAAPSPRRSRLPLIIAIVLALAAPAVWFATRSGTESAAPAPVATASHAPSAADDAALEELLARADKALAAGALTAPANANAADLYREALRYSARDPRAVNGLEQVIDHLVTDAEAQLQEHHLDVAQQLADQARAINADHPRVTFLAAQIGAQRERLVLGKAQRAAASGDVGAALAVLDDASRGGHRSTLVDEAREQLAQKQIDARVADFIARGRAALASGALIEPAEQNARFYLQSAQALAPSDPNLQQARQELAARLVTESRQAATAGNPELADNWANAAADLGADPADVAALHTAAQQLRGATKADSLVRTAALFNQRLAQARLIEPASDSAKYYLEQLSQAEPASAATLAARTAFGTRLLDEAHNAAKAQDLAGARRWLTEAQNAGASAEAIRAVEAELGAAPGGTAKAAGVANDSTAVAGPAKSSGVAQELAAAPAVAAKTAGMAADVPPPPAAPARAMSTPAGEPKTAADKTYIDASTLTRSHYVAPQFPVTARERLIEGWVDVQFLVNTDGTLSEVNIVGAQPVGVFEQTALDAVRRWRYLPVIRDGQTIAQLARVRVRFAVQP
jgi:protein TonB